MWEVVFGYLPIHEGGEAQEPQVEVWVVEVASRVVGVPEAV